jgi:hypothetical protein
MIPLVVGVESWLASLALLAVQSVCQRPHAGAVLADGQLQAVESVRGARHWWC